jgi:hypothetical protein
MQDFFGFRCSFVGLNRLLSPLASLVGAVVEDLVADFSFLSV